MNQPSVAFAILVVSLFTTIVCTFVTDTKSMPQVFVSGIITMLVSLAVYATLVVPNLKEDKPAPTAKAELCPVGHVFRHGELFLDKDVCIPGVYVNK